MAMNGEVFASRLDERVLPGMRLGRHIVHDPRSHAFGVEQALLALVLRPIITGIGWYSSFDTPDASGLVAVASATVRGGHEVVADQIDAGNKLVWFWNSWGPGFGVGGRFCMAFDTWQRLLQEHGDVTVPLP